MKNHWNKLYKDFASKLLAVTLGFNNQPQLITLCIVHEFMRFNNHSQLAQMTQIIYLHKLACNWNAFRIKYQRILSFLPLFLFINKLTIPSCWLAFWFCNNTESDYMFCLKWCNLWIWKSSDLVSEEDYPNKSWWILLSYILNQIQFFQYCFLWEYYTWN